MTKRRGFSSQAYIDGSVPAGDTAAVISFTPARTVHYTEGGSVIEERVYYLPISQYQVGIYASFSVETR